MRQNRKPSNKQSDEDSVSGILPSSSSTVELLPRFKFTDKNGKKY
jgi:hypothetical protein